MSVTTLVFDAYGTLFDVTGAARLAAADFPAFAPLWPRLADDWRRKQLEYTWQRTMTGQYSPFDRVTADALDWALAAHGQHDPDLRATLLANFDRLPAFPEAAATLANLHATGLRLAILSNGTPAMLDSMTRAAGVADLFKALISVEETRLYKPSWQVYALVESRLNVKPQDVLFVSANGWDAAGAAHFGFRTAWINRAGLPQDRLPARPLHETPDLSHLPRLIA